MSVYEHDDQGLRIIGYNQGVYFYDPTRELRCVLYLGEDHTLHSNCGSSVSGGGTPDPATGKIPVAPTDPSLRGGHLTRSLADLLYVRLDGNNWASWIPIGGTQSVVGSFNLQGAAFQYKITGRHALSMPGTRNLLAGDGAGAALTTGAGNVLMGYQVGATLTDNAENVIIGSGAAASAADVDNAVVIGFNTLAGATALGGYNCVVIGDNAGGLAEIGESVILGSNALRNTDATSYSADEVLIGYGIASTAAVVYQGDYNVIIGHSAAVRLADADSNVIVGYRAAYAASTATANAILGFQAGYALTIGGTNLLAGYRSGYKLTEGNLNVILGGSAGGALTTGSNNTIVGYQAGNAITTDNGGVYLGYQAGFYESAANKLFIDNAQRASEADARLKALVYGVFDAATANQYLTINGHLITADDATFGGFARTSTAIYRRYYHLPLGSANPGASGPTWVPADANTTGGWRLSNATWRLRGQADVHADWDGEDLFVEVHFMLNVAGVGAGDTVDLRLNVYYKGDAEAATKTQAVEVPVTVGAAAQYTQFSASFTIDHDAVGAVVDTGDIMSFILNLETDSSEVDDIVVTGMEFYYATTHTGIESGDA